MKVVIYPQVISSGSLGLVPLRTNIDGTARRILPGPNVLRRVRVRQTVQDIKIVLFPPLKKTLVENIRGARFMKRRLEPGKTFPH